MKPNVFLKSSVRRPARTLLLFLLTGLISFAAVSQVTEYLLIRRKTDMLGSYYHTIGALQTSSKDGNIFKGAELLSGSSYVEMEDRRRACSGVLQGGLYNADIDGVTSDTDEMDDNESELYPLQSVGIHVSDVIVYADLLSKSHMTKAPGNENSVEEYFLQFRVNEVVAGYPEYVKEGKTIKLSYVAKKDGELNPEFDSLKKGKQYLIRAYFDPWRFNPHLISWKKNAGEHLTWKPLSGKLWSLPVEEGTSADFNASELKELKSDLELLRENQHAMYVIGTKDMTAIPDMQESAKKYYLVAGRWLDREDDLKRNPACVVNSNFAKLRGLSIGDSIRLKLRHLELNYRGYIVHDGSTNSNSWRKEKTLTETFQIVGLYNFLNSNYSLTAYTNSLYIPDSCLSSDEYQGNYVQDDSYSFVLKSYRDKDAFLAENRAKLAAMGMTVTFIDNGSANYWSSADSLKFSALLSASVFGAVLLLAFGLAVFLYLHPRRKEFAIQRALGQPRRGAAFQMAWPFVLLGAVGIFVGGALGWVYAFRAAEKSMAGLQTANLQAQAKAAAAAGLPLGWLFALCGCALAVLALFTWAGTGFVSRRPVLELLQGNPHTGAGKRRGHR